MQHIGLLIFKDHVIVCHDAIDSARLWARRGYKVDLHAVDNGRFPQPEMDEPGVRLNFTKTLYGRFRRLASRHGAVSAATRTSNLYSRNGNQNYATGFRSNDTYGVYKQSCAAQTLGRHRTQWAKLERRSAGAMDTPG